MIYRARHEEWSAVPAMLVVDIICLRAPLVAQLESANSAPGASVVNHNKPAAKTSTLINQFEVLLIIRSSFTISFVSFRFVWKV
jgi:hypothetical protein